MGSTKFVLISQTLLVLHIVLQDKPTLELDILFNPMPYAEVSAFVQVFPKKLFMDREGLHLYSSLLMKFHLSFPAIDVTDFVAHCNFRWQEAISLCDGWWCVGEQRRMGPLQAHC